MALSLRPRGQPAWPRYIRLPLSNSFAFAAVVLAHRPCPLSLARASGESLPLCKITGHADPRTTKLYDRRQQKVTRGEVEGIRYEKKQQTPGAEHA